MENGLPMLNCLLHQTLRSLCTFSDTSTKWVYAVFWRILPRNYPPPNWDHTLDRAKGNKRNWILVWEDGFCDFHECERAGSGYIKGRFGADIFFKMSHEVYNYGEGLVGKVAADNSHKWVFGDSLNENDANFIPQPRAWEVQFNSGIQTIAVVSVREGIIQLGSFDKAAEDLNLVISIQRKFSYLLSIPGIYVIQRTCLSIHKPTNNLIKVNETEYGKENKLQMIGSKRQTCIELTNHRSSIKSINLGYNSPQNVMAAELPLLPNIPNLLPSMSWQQQLKNTRHNIKDDECAGFTAINQMIKSEPSQEENRNIPSNYRLEFEDREVVTLGFGQCREAECTKSQLIGDI